MSLCDGSQDLIISYSDSEELASDSNIIANLSKDSVFYHWCQYPEVSAYAHYLIAAILIFICVVSITGNALVVVVFSKYRRMKSSANDLIVNLAISDLLNGCLHPMAIYSSFMRTWAFGKIGCELYAAFCGLCGFVSMVTITLISIERFIDISVKPSYGSIGLVTWKTKYIIIAIWFYCLAVITPPFFGWGTFVPEGFLTSCSFDYLTRSWSNYTYFIYIFILGFFLPVSIIIICYSFIIFTIRRNESNMRENIHNVYTMRNRNRLRIKRNDYKTAEMVILVIFMFLVSWIPYCIVAMIGQFGNPELLTPWITVLPSLFAKMSTIYNPAIYSLFHRRFRAMLRNILRKTKNPTSAQNFNAKWSKLSSRMKFQSYPCCQNLMSSNDIQKISLSNWERQSHQRGCTSPYIAEIEKKNARKYTPEEDHPSFSTVNQPSTSTSVPIPIIRPQKKSENKQKLKS